MKTDYQCSHCDARHAYDYFCPHHNKSIVRNKTLKVGDNINGKKILEVRKGWVEPKKIGIDHVFWGWQYNSRQIPVISILLEE